MATIENDSFKELPKNTGPIRVYRWKGKVVIATKGRRTMPRTKSQNTCTMIFSQMRRLFSETKPYINIGFATAPKRPEDRAMKVNYRTAFTGEYPDIRIDYGLLQLSEGPLPMPSDIRAQAGEDNTVELSWQHDGNGDAEDWLMVMLYNPTATEAVIYTEAAQRTSGKTSLRVAPEWKNMPFHIYATFHNRRSTLASDSAYLGSMSLDFTCPAEFDYSHLFKHHKRRPWKRSEPKDFNAMGISGKLGPVNFYTYRNKKVIVRANPLKKNTHKSEGAQSAIERLRIVSHFLYQLHPFVKTGFASYAAYTLTHAAAVKANIKRIIAGEWPNYHIDYLAARLSEGPLEAPMVHDARRDNNTVTLRWKTDYTGMGSDDDCVMMAIYNITLDKAVVQKTKTKRSEGCASMSIPEDWKECDCVAYMAFTDADKGLCSETKSLTVKG